MLARLWDSNRDTKQQNVSRAGTLHMPMWESNPKPFPHKENAITDLANRAVECSERALCTTVARGVCPCGTIGQRTRIVLRPHAAEDREGLICTHARVNGDSRHPVEVHLMLKCARQIVRCHSDIASRIRALSCMGPTSPILDIYMCNGVYYTSKMIACV